MVELGLVDKLTGKNEPKGLYQEFFGHPTKEMLRLITVGYDPISVARVIGRRESAPADVVDAWRRNYIFTGDGVAYDGRKNAKIVLDAALLHEINPSTRLNNGAMVLSNDQWEELHGYGVRYLSVDKVAQAHKKGFVKRNGVWQPENTIVGEVWEHLSRGKDLKEYIGMVTTASNSDKVMWLRFDWLRFDRSIHASPVIRSLVLDNVDYDSNVSGGSLYYDAGRLVGEATEAHVARTTKNQGPYRILAYVQKSELKVVLDEFKMKDPVELRKILQLYKALQPYHAAKN